MEELKTLIALDGIRREEYDGEPHPNLICLVGAITTKFKQFVFLIQQIIYIKIVRIKF